MVGIPLIIIWIILRFKGIFYMNRINIVVAGHDLKFAEGLISYFKSSPYYNLRVDKWAGHNAHDEENSEECLLWADVIICEWGLGNAVWYSINKRKNQKLFVRMHRQELETSYPNKFIIDNIDKIIAISPYVYEEFYRKFKFPRSKMKMIFNYVDMEKYILEKSPDSRFNLGMIGFSPKLKRIDLSIDLFEKLWQRDNRYKLYLKGRMPQEYSWIWNREEQRVYYEGIYKRIENSEWKENVIFDGFGSDVNDWLKKIGFILSFSDYESFHLAIAEGMASGAFPIIRKWEGANTIYKEEWLVESINHARDKILEINQLSDEQIISMQKKLNKFISDNFSLDKISKEFDKLIRNT